MLKNNWGFRFKHRSKALLEEILASFGGNGIYNLKGKASLKNKHALVIYTAEAISPYLRHNLSAFTPLYSHSGFKESIALLEVLFEQGYTVDYFHLIDTPKIEWNKYELVIDSSHQLENAPLVTGQRRIYYATGCHWKTFQENALIHADAFYKRTGVLLYPDREIKAHYSDDAADTITCFGGSYQTKSFLSNGFKVKRIHLSTTYLPGDFKKKIALKNKFMWYGGYGPLHKGLDLVVEAFKKMPDMTLHILGNLEHNSRFFKWFKQTTEQHTNIHYEGWATPDSKKFREFATLCDAIVFTSSSEGGAGSVIQCLQFGLIPILNNSTAIDLENTRFNIKGSSPDDEIESLIQNVWQFSQTDLEDLQNYTVILQNKYCAENTLANYSKSLSQVIQLKA